MRDFKVLKNISPSKVVVTAGGNIYEFASGEYKLVHADAVQAAIENSMSGAIGGAKLVEVKGSDIPREFVREMLAKDTGKAFLTNTETDKYEIMYNAILYTFKKGVILPFTKDIARAIYEHSYSERNKKYALKYFDDIPKKEEANSEKSIVAEERKPSKGKLK